MSKQLNLDEVINNFAEYIKMRDGTIPAPDFNEAHDGFKHAKQQITQMVAQIIGQDAEQVEHEEWDCPCGLRHAMGIDYQKENTLRASQRKRARSTGVDI